MVRPRVPDDSRSVHSAARAKSLGISYSSLSPGIVQVWFQAMPVFIDEGSVFAQIAHQHPRIKIEDALAKRGEDSERFVEPFMRIWDDPRYQTWGCTSTETASCGSTSYAWRLLSGGWTTNCHGALLYNAQGRQLRKDLMSKINLRILGIRRPRLPSMPRSISSINSHVIAFGALIVREHRTPYIASLMLRFSEVGVRHERTPRYHATGGPILSSYSTGSDSLLRALRRVNHERGLAGPHILFHFYRAARKLLAPERCWWAYERSCVMEELILRS